MPTFPLTRAQFFGNLRLLVSEFDLPAAQEISRTAAGEVLTADLGARLWRAQVALAPVSLRDAEALRVQFSQLRMAGASFVMNPFPTCGPKASPTGTALTGYTPRIAAVSGGVLSIKGLPPGFTLARGDCLSFSYGASPLRYAFHQVADTVAADGTGLTPNFEVQPGIRSGAVPELNVTLYQPRMKAVLTDLDMGEIRGPKRYGISFAAIQTLR
ncbi:hypothetical protein EYE35_20970 [Cereibacter sphaeroides]|nr:hypothetical protein EYE35_20970 [Cereibacter sphaeroides]